MKTFFKTDARKFILIVIFVVSLSSGLAQARSNCEQDVAKVVDATNAKFIRSAGNGRFVHLSHSSANELQVDCGLIGPSIFINWSGAYPPKSFFELSSKAGEAMFSIKASVITNALKACHHKALGDKLLELGEIHMKGIGVECQSFARDGSGTAFTIYQDVK